MRCYVCSDRKSHVALKYSSSSKSVIFRCLSSVLLDFLACEMDFDAFNLQCIRCTMLKCTVRSLSIPNELFNHFHKNKLFTYLFGMHLYSYYISNSSFVDSHHFKSSYIQLKKNKNKEIKKTKWNTKWIWIQWLCSILVSKNKTNSKLNCQPKRWTCCCYCFVMEQIRLVKDSIIFRLGWREMNINGFMHKNVTIFLY